MTIYRIIKKVKVSKIMEYYRHLNTKKTMRTLEVVAAVAATIEKDAWLTVSNLALAHQVSVSTIFAIFDKELGLVKKSARWVPKFLSQDQKEERVRTCSNFAATDRRESMAFFARIFTMVETMVSSTLLKT